MSIAHLYIENEPMTFALTLDIASEFGLVIRRRQRWSLTNIADEQVTVNEREVPIGVAAHLYPFDAVTAGDVKFIFTPVLRGDGPNE